MQEDKSGQRLWIVVKSLRGRIPGYQLNEGDVLRFGKVPMTVKKILGSGERSATRIGEKRSIGKQETSECAETHLLQDPGQCRICLGEASFIDNPLISPCACDGSLKYVHLMCLREWLKSKMSVRESGSVVMYAWHVVDCELCREQFPETVKFANTTLALFDFHLADLAYIVLQDLQSSPDAQLFYVISLYEGDSIRIVLPTQGRGHDSEIRIADISVSRFHASLKLRDGGFYIEDRGSKFGTLVQVQSGVTVTRATPGAIQIGRTVVDFSVQRDAGSLLSCCFCCFPRRAATVEPERGAADTLNENERDQGEEDRAESVVEGGRSGGENQGTGPAQLEQM